MVTQQCNNQTYNNIQVSTYLRERLGTKYVIASTLLDMPPGGYTMPLPNDHSMMFSNDNILSSKYLSHDIDHGTEVVRDKLFPKII